MYFCTSAKIGDYQTKLLLLLLAQLLILYILAAATVSQCVIALAIVIGGR